MESTFWLEAVNTILVTLEGALLGEHATPLAAVASSGAETRKHTRRAASDTLSDIELPGSPVKRRRDSLEGTYVHGGVTKPTLKSRKLSKALSNQFARSLSMSSNHNRNGSYSESPEELGAQIEHNSPFGCESVSPLSSTHSSTSSLSSTSLLASNSSAWRPSESPFAAGTISAPALMLNRALVYPASSRSLKSQEKSKLPANRSLGTHLHQGSRSSMDLDHSDSNAQSTGNESINAITPVNDDVFGELLRPIPQDVFNSSTELIDVAVQRWAMMQTAYTEESPAQLVESLQQRIARLEELVPFVTQQALGEQRYSSIYHQYSLQGERLREFCQAISEITSIGEWLYQRQFQLLSVVLPALPPVLPSLQQVMQLVRINEDMNNLVLWTPEFSASLAEMTREYEELVAGKRAIYGDIISQCGLRWKAVGLPVDEVLLLRVRQWMESTAGSCVSRIARAYERRAKSSSAFGKEDITTDGLVQCGSQLLHAVAMCANMCGGSFSSLAPHVIYITAECSQWTCNKLKSPASGHTMPRPGQATVSISGSKVSSLPAYHGKQLDSRAMRLVQACESVTKMMSLARTILAQDRSVFDISVKAADIESVSASLQSLASSLVEASWTLAEVLAAFRSDGQFANPSGMLLLFADFVVKFTKRVVEFGSRSSGTAPAINHRVRHMQNYVKELDLSLR